jgi:hypothetical protein
VLVSIPFAAFDLVTTYEALGNQAKETAEQVSIPFAAFDLVRFLNATVNGIILLLVSIPFAAFDLVRDRPGVDRQGSPYRSQFPSRPLIS